MMVSCEILVDGRPKNNVVSLLFQVEERIRNCDLKMKENCFITKLLVWRHRVTLFLLLLLSVSLG